jgi:hypothetical protein
MMLVWLIVTIGIVVATTAFIVRGNGYRLMVCYITPKWISLVTVCPIVCMHYLDDSIINLASVGCI